MAGRRLSARRAGRRGGAGGVPVAGALTAATVAAGCLSNATLLESRGTGVARCYRVPYELLWPSIEEAVGLVGLVVERSNRDNGFLLAHSYEPEVEDPQEMALDADQGEGVAIFAEDEGPGVWAVEVVSRPRFALDPTPRDWTDAIFLALEDLLPDAAFAPDEDLAACTRVRGGRGPGASPPSPALDGPGRRPG